MEGRNRGDFSMEEMILAAGLSREAILLAVYHKPGSTLACLRDALVKGKNGCTLSHLGRLRDSLVKDKLLHVVGGFNYHLTHEGEFKVSQLLAQENNPQEAVVID